MRVCGLVEECLKYSDEVIVCDDGSIDDTTTEAKRGGATVISHAKNRGKGAALKSLFNVAKDLKADVIVTIDGDGPFLPQEIDKIVKPILDGKADVVIGYGFEKDNEIPAYRKIGMKILDKITNMASELPFRDTQSGFRAYSHKATELITFESDQFGVDAEILMDASRKGLRIVQEKVTVLYDTGEKTSTKNHVSHSADVVNSLLEQVVLRRPLRYLGLPGVSLTIVGIAFSIVVISLFNQTRYFSIPWTLVSMGAVLIGILLILMSIVLFSIGRALRKGYA
ncbi:MAG: glycosyl transferase [Thaumarchaeota archaeon 13_1_20CM_2_39_20]|nr:MAG: glycosyl transferase [Thaumarchaeota archaeon 13_1_20CM_2_39_20]